MKNKGVRFFQSLCRGNRISRKQASARWNMGNPSAWVKIFEDEMKNPLSEFYAPNSSIVRVYKTRSTMSNRRVRTVEYRLE